MAKARALWRPLSDQYRSKRAWRRAARIAAYAAKSRKSTSPKRRRKRRTARGYASDYALGRAYGIRAPKGMRRKAARRFVAKAGVKRARKAAGKVLSVHDILRKLKRGQKAWVCVGYRRTGCGGGKRRYGGSRQMGVLRP